MLCSSIEASCQRRYRCSYLMCMHNQLARLYSYLPCLDSRPACPRSKAHDMDVEMRGSSVDQVITFFYRTSKIAKEIDKHQECHAQEISSQERKNFCRLGTLLVPKGQGLSRGKGATNVFKTEPHRCRGRMNEAVVSA